LETVYKHTDGREQKEDPGSKPQGIIAIANAIPDMGALSVLSLRKNRLRTEEGGAILAQMLKRNSTLTELDVSENGLYSDNSGGDGPAFAKGISEGLADNGAMTKLDARDNDIDDEGKRALQQASGRRWGA
jgi:hypothetical protein